jgi:hypothetical protein
MAEENKDTVLGAKKFEMNITSSGTTPKISVSAVGDAGTQYETSSGSKVYESYVVSDLASKVTQDKTNSDQYSAKVEYHGGEVYANVYLAAPSITSTSNSVLPVMANAMTDADKAKNLIVVGGSCINTVAAKLLTGLETPVCGAAFSAKTQVGAGQYMIKGFDSPYATGKIAVLVAGYEAAQTTDAVKAAKAKATLTKDLNEVGPALS